MIWRAAARGLACATVVVIATYGVLILLLLWYSATHPAPAGATGLMFFASAGEMKIFAAACALAFLAGFAWEYRRRAH